MTQHYIDLRNIRILGARLHVHWAVILAIAAILALTIARPLNAIVAVTAYFGMILLHETGHAFVARRLGYKPSDIYLGLVHGLCVVEASSNPMDEAIIAWGGVLAQLSVALPLIFLSMTTSLAQFDGFGPLVAFLGYISLMMALVNLIPVYVFDGVKAWAVIPLLRSRQKKPVASKKVSRVIKGPWSGR